MHRPYIGVTGFMRREEAEHICGLLPANSPRDVMVGVLVSPKTMRGEQNKWPNRYPNVEALKDIFATHSRALNLIHYNTKEPETLYDQLMRLTDLAGPLLHGFQLNLCWPSGEAIWQYRKANPDKKIVLQIGHHAFEEMGNVPVALAEKLQEYEDLADYALLDPSGGFGKPFDPRIAQAYLREICEKHLNMGLGVAGGLSPATIEDLLCPLRREFPDLSIDAEGRLRDENDHLDLRTTRRYVLKAFALFS